MKIDELVDVEKVRPVMRRGRHALQDVNPLAMLDDETSSSTVNVMSIELLDSYIAAQ
jgi:hypothetical protein